MEHGIERPVDEDVLRDVVPHEAEPAVLLEVGEVLHVAREEVVHRDDLVAFGEQAVADVASQKPRAPGDQNAHAHPRPTPA